MYLHRPLQWGVIWSKMSQLSCPNNVCVYVCVYLWMSGVRRRSLVSSEPCLPINSALCCPRSLWKMKHVYHCDWHCVVSPFFSLHVHTPSCPPLPTITSIAPLRHTYTLRCTYTLQAQTASDSAAAAAAACSLLWRAWCATATPIHWVCHTLVAGGRNSHVCVVNVCSCNGNTTGKLLHCVGQHGNAQFCQESLAPGMMKYWWDGSRQHAAEKCSLPESMFHTAHTYLHLGCFTV